MISIPVFSVVLQFFACCHLFFYFKRKKGMQVCNMIFSMNLFHVIANSEIFGRNIAEILLLASCCDSENNCNYFPALISDFQLIAPL